MAAGKQTESLWDDDHETGAQCLAKRDQMRDIRSLEGTGGRLVASMVIEGPARAAAAGFGPDDTGSVQGSLAELRKNPGRMFHAFDRDDSGTINSEEFRQMLPQLGLFLSAAKAIKVFRMLDTDESGELSIDEFKAAAFALNPSSGGPVSISLDNLIGPREAFALFDRDNSGSISETEFVWVLEFMGYDIKLDDEQMVEKMFHKYDKDDSGAIEQHEFHQAWLDLCDVREELRGRGVTDFPEWTPRWKLVEMLDGLLRDEQVKESQALAFARRWVAWQATLKHRRSALRAARAAANDALMRALDAAGQVYVLGTGTSGQFSGGYACDLNPGSSRIASLWLNRVDPVIVTPDSLTDGKAEPSIGTVADISRRIHEEELEESHAQVLQDQSRAASAAKAARAIPKSTKRDRRLDHHAHARGSGLAGPTLMVSAAGRGNIVRTDGRTRRSDIRSLQAFQPSTTDIMALSKRLPSKGRPVSSFSETSVGSATRQSLVFGAQQPTPEICPDDDDVHPDEALAGEPAVDLSKRNPSATRGNPFLGTTVSSSTLGLWGRGVARAWASRSLSVAQTGKGRMYQWGVVSPEKGATESSEMLASAFGRAADAMVAPATLRALDRSGWSASGPGHPFVLSQLVHSKAQIQQAIKDSVSCHHSRGHAPSLTLTASASSDQVASAGSQQLEVSRRGRETSQRSQATPDALDDLISSKGTTAPLRPPGRRSRRRAKDVGRETDSVASTAAVSARERRPRERTDSASTFSRLGQSARALLGRFSMRRKKALGNGHNVPVEADSEQISDIAATAAASSSVAVVSDLHVDRGESSDCATALEPVKPGRFALPLDEGSRTFSPLTLHRKQQVGNMLAMLDQLGLSQPVDTRNPIKAHKTLVRSIMPVTNCDPIRDRVRWRGFDATSLPKEHLADLWARIQQVELARLGEHGVAHVRELEQRIQRNRDDKLFTEAEADQKQLFRLWQPLKLSLATMEEAEATAEMAKKLAWEQKLEAAWQSHSLQDQASEQDLRLFASSDTTLLAPMGHPVTPRGFKAEDPHGEPPRRAEADDGRAFMQTPRWTAGATVSDVAMCDKHAIIVLPTGAVYAAGAGGAGRLGLGPVQGTSRATPAPGAGLASDDRAMFVRIPGLAGHHVVQVSAGVSHSAAVTRTGRLFTWGSASSGKLGVGDLGSLFEAFAAQPVRVGVAARIPGQPSMLSAVKMVSCGSSHTACVSVDGNLFVWGDSGSGRLGLPRRRSPGTHEVADAVIAEPTLVGMFADRGEHIAAVSCGASHTIALTPLRGQGVLRTGGRVWVAGSHVACGARGEEFQPVTGMITRYNVLQVSAGRSHCVALTDDGEVFSWGSNEGKCLGIPSFRDDGDVVEEPTLIRALYTAPANLARSGLASACQSSTYNRAEARRAIDGNHTSLERDACSHTQREACPWIDVELGQEATICAVRVWNRSDSPIDPRMPADAYQRRLFPCWLLVFQEKPDRRNGHISLDAALSKAVAKQRFAAVTDCIEWTPPPDCKGRYVRLQLEQVSHLHITEFEVMGQPSQANRLHPVTHIDAGDRCTIATIAPTPAKLLNAYIEAVATDPEAAQVLRQLPLYRECFDTLGYTPKPSETYAALQTLWMADEARPRATTALGNSASVTELWAMLMGEEPPEPEEQDNEEDDQAEEDDGQESSLAMAGVGVAGFTDSIPDTKASAD